MNRLIKFTSGYEKRIAIAALIGATTIASSVSLLATSSFLLSAAARESFNPLPSIAALGVAPVGVRFFGILRGVARYAERLVSHDLTFRLLARIRLWFYRSIEPLAPAALQNQRSGDLLSRAISDVESLENFYVRVMSPPLVALVIVLGMAIFMGIFDPVLAAVLTAFLLVQGVGLTLLSRFLGRTPGISLVSERAALRADFIDSVQGLPDLLAFNAVPGQWQKIDASAQRLAKAQLDLANIGGFQNGLAAFLSGAAVWTMLWLAIPLVSAGKIDGLFLASIALAAMASFEAVNGLPQAAQMFESNIQAAERLFQMADTPPVVSTPAEPIQIPDAASPHLEIKDLHFTYPEASAPALRGLNLSLATGKRIALVGPSGAGKSTLGNLLSRFWDYAEGEITVNGADLRATDPDAARALFSVVAQGTYLFHTSLRQNLLIARPRATDEEIFAAMKAASLDEFVQSLPNGLETEIGERGVQLSGGQRQRLAIARALLKGAPIFLLDEPTANLDADTEAQVIATLHANLQNRSALWITHRLIGMEQMDEIVVLDAGQVVERGNHAALLEQGGLYKKLYDLQHGAIVE
jgi:ATP-binding cassette, subfamily C, bacterial CydC